MKDLQTTFAQRRYNYRTYMVMDGEGNTIASHLELADMLDLIRLLTTHNGVIAWTVVPDYIEYDGEQCHDDTE